MWMIGMLVATNAALSAMLFRPDATITKDLIWADRAVCEAVRAGHIEKHPPPENIGLVCLRVPEHIAEQFRPVEDVPTEI